MTGQHVIFATTSEHAAGKNPQSQKQYQVDGNNRKTTEVVGSLFRLLGKREGSSGFSSGEGYFPPAADEASTIQPKREDSAPAAAPPVNQPPATDGGDDDLPF